MHQETKKFLSLILLWYLLYFGDLKLNLHYLQGLPVLSYKVHLYFSSSTVLCEPCKNLDFVIYMK